MENGILEINDPPEKHHILLQNIFDEEMNIKQREDLKIIVRGIQNKVKEMWQIIWAQ